MPSQGILEIGRAEDADISIDHPSVSRRHARLSIDDAVTIRDLESHNGTCVNGQRLADGARTLASGDVLRLGEAVLVVRVERRGRRGDALSEESLRARLDEEVERSLRYGRPLAVAMIDLHASDERRVQARLGHCLSRCEVAGWLQRGLLVVLLPELRRSTARQRLLAILDALAPIAPNAAAGLAVCPGDGGDGDALLGAARAAAELPSAERVRDAAAAAQRLTLGNTAILIADPAMSRIYALLERLAKSELAVLILGETGVGKEAAAHAVHAGSSRASGPFIAVNAAALPAALIESELFGYRRGAFSGAERDKLGFLEAANRGTVFFDEIGELPLPLQAKLLRVLDTKQVQRLGDIQPIAADFRVVAATHRDLRQEVAAGRFREDLYYRLGAATVELPPLRDRPRDIPLLSRALLERACARQQREELTLSDATMHALARYPFPGNVRELANIADYLAATVVGEVAEPWHLPAELGRRSVSTRALNPAEEAPTKFVPIADEVAELERRRMQEALEASAGVQSQAARLISMPRRTFLTKLKKYGL